MTEYASEYVSDFNIGFLLNKVGSICDYFQSTKPLQIKYFQKKKKCFVRIFMIFWRSLVDSSNKL